MEGLSGENTKRIFACGKIRPLKPRVQVISRYFHPSSIPSIRIWSVLLGCYAFAFQGLVVRDRKLINANLRLKVKLT